MNSQDAVIKINGLLELQRKVVGVKIVTTKAEYDAYDALELTKPMHYCVAVKCAMAGHSIKLSKLTAGCSGGNRALGIVEPLPQFFDGSSGCRLGLYKDNVIAAGVAKTVPIYPPNTYGVVVKPLELFEDDPDIVLITAFPRTIMRLLQGYTYSYGLPAGMLMSGNQAVCVECTVTPSVTDSMNVSMLCAGTRYNANWEDADAMVGIPFSKFHGLVKGIECTVNPIEPDERKKRIEDSLEQANLLEIEVEYGKTYYKNK
ncbi:MAG: DUF169 domain-containing protein [Firmicutes bacterium]|nr:DUF169 domain-containing protein [Bacillota bacterium]